MQVHGLLTCIKHALFADQTCPKLSHVSIMKSDIMNIDLITLSLSNDTSALQNQAMFG